MTRLMSAPNLTKVHVIITPFIHVIYDNRVLMRELNVDGHNDTGTLCCCVCVSVVYMLWLGARPT